MKISRGEFLSLCGLEDETLNAWIEDEWLIPSGPLAEMSFSDIDIARVGLIRELQANFGVNDKGVGVILNLVDQLYGMRRTLVELRHVIGTSSEPIDRAPGSTGRS